MNPGWLKELTVIKYNSVISVSITVVPYPLKTT